MLQRKQRKTYFESDSSINVRDTHVGTTLIYTGVEAGTMYLPDPTGRYYFDLIFINNTDFEVVVSGGLGTIPGRSHAIINNLSGASWVISVSGGAQAQAAPDIYVFYSVSEVVDPDGADILEYTGANAGSLTLTTTGIQNGCTKKIRNSGGGLLTLISVDINGAATAYLYPREARELVWTGSGWRTF